MAYKSKFELDFAKELKKNGIKFEYEPEVVEFLQPEKKRKYTPDFKIRTKTGVTCFIETKGKLTAEDRKKLVLVKEQHPKKKFILVFMNSANKLRKNSKTTYSDWAKKAGFEWYDFRFGLPKGWVKDAD